MTRTSTARIEIRRWKAHTCLGCGCRYAYLLVRKLAYGGSSPEQAAEKAQAAADRAMAREVDRQPCPTCGLYQPDMIAGPRRAFHRWTLLPALLGWGLIAGLYLGDALQADRALTMAMGEVVLIAALGLVVDRRNPNRDLEANRRTAQREAAAQRVRTLQPATAAPPLPPGKGWGEARSGRYGLLALGLAVAALLALALPELMQWPSGWALNADWYPPVVGPGDTTCFSLPCSISSIKGYWTGTSRVTARVEGEPQAAEFPIDSSTRQADWSRWNQAERDERPSRRQLWVRVKLPSGAEYAGKTLVCKIALTVRYPDIRNDGVLGTSVRDCNVHDITLKLAAPLSARTYCAWWWGGFAAGAVGLMLLDSRPAPRHRGFADRGRPHGNP